MKTEFGRLFVVLCLAVFLACALGGCTPAGREGADATSPGSAGVASATALPTAEGLPAEAVIERLDLQVQESFPVQVNAVVTGSLPDACSIIEPKVERTAATFVVVLFTSDAANAVCEPEPQPFEQVIPLDVLGLQAGTYNVVVRSANVANGAFTLEVDNIVPEAAATPTLVPDVVQQTGARAQTALAQRLGVSSEAVAVVAVESQEWPDACLGLAGAEEACAQQVTPGYLVTLESNDATYVVHMDASGENFRLEPTPTPSPAQANCKDSIAFVRDVTAPDNARIQANTEFVKTWTLGNSGTCTWGPDYAVVFVNGDQMKGPDAQPLTSTVTPGSNVDLSLTLVSPDKRGTYKGNWKLRDANGNLFGLGNKGADPFWVQIVVP